MSSQELFPQALSLEAPWFIKEVKFDGSQKRLGRRPENLGWIIEVILRKRILLQSLEFSYLQDLILGFF